MANLRKTNNGSKMTPSDLNLYKTLSRSDLNDINEILYARIIVTGNYERQELNVFVAAGIWARHFRTHVIRWEKQTKCDKWKGQPNTEEEISEAKKETYFYEYFVPMCPAYLTHNINPDANLADGTSIKENSLAFDSIKEKRNLETMIKTNQLEVSLSLKNFSCGH